MGRLRGLMGGAPQPVIPVRIADWVVRFTTSTMVKASTMRGNRAHVLSMSMGGLSSEA